MHPLTRNDAIDKALVVNATKDGEMTLSDDLLKGAKRIAAHTGFGEREIYVFASRGDIPAFKVGKHLCCRVSELDAWLRKGPKPE